MVDDLYPAGFIQGYTPRDVVVVHGTERPTGVVALDFRRTDKNPIPALNERPAVWAADFYKDFGTAAGHAVDRYRGGDPPGRQVAQIYYLDVPQAQVLSLNPYAYPSPFAASDAIRAAIDQYGPDVVETPGGYLILEKARKKVGITRVKGGAAGAHHTDYRDLPLDPASPIPASLPSEAFCRVMLASWEEEYEYLKDNISDIYGTEQLYQAAGELAYWTERCAEAQQLRERRERQAALGPDYATDTSLPMLDADNPGLQGDKPGLFDVAALKARYDKAQADAAARRLGQQDLLPPPPEPPPPRKPRPRGRKAAGGQGGGSLPSITLQR